MINDNDLNQKPVSHAKRNQFPDEVRQAVQQSYRENGGNLTQAARAHGISPATARRWQQKDQATPRDWNLPRSQAKNDTGLLGRSLNWLAQSSREALVGDLLEEYLELHKEAMDAVKKQIDTPVERVNALSRLSQALDRTLRALGKASPELSRLAVAKWVLERQAEFVKNHFPDHLPVFAEVLEPFGAELLREVGKQA